jgi:hypothetical protein
MSVENYKFTPEDEPPKGPRQPLPDIPPEMKAYYEALYQKEKTDWEEEKKRDKRSLRKALSVCVAGLALYGYGFYKSAMKNREIEESKPANAYWLKLEKSSHLDERRKADLRKRMAAIKGRLGEEAFVLLNRSLDYAKQPMPAHPDVRGFEQMGISNKDAASLFAADLYPAGTVDGNLQGIVYDGKFLDLNILDKEGRPSGAEGEVSNDAARILFHKHEPVPTAEGALKVIKYFSFIASHESSHKRDWGLDFRLTPEQRLDFLFEAYEVFLNSNQHSTHTDVMDKENERLEKQFGKNQKHYKFYIQLEEWWADMCTEALNYPEDFFRDASPKEAALIKKWFVRGDKKFDFYQANGLRKQRQSKLEMAYQNHLTETRVKRQALPKRPMPKSGRR